MVSPNELAVVETSVEQRGRSLTPSGVAVIASWRSNTWTRPAGVVICVSPSTLKPWREWRARAGRHTAVVGGRRSVDRAIEVTLPLPSAVIRSIPHAGAREKKGVSAIAGGAHVTKDDLDWAESILGAVGTVVRVSERNIDAVTDSPGPMPAYLYLACRGVIEAGVHQDSARRRPTSSWSVRSEGFGRALTSTVRRPRSFPSSGRPRAARPPPECAHSRVARSLGSSTPCRRRGSQSTNGSLRVQVGRHMATPRLRPRKLSEPTIARLPVYHASPRVGRRAGSIELTLNRSAKLAGVTATTVSRDLADSDPSVLAGRVRRHV